MILKWSLPYIHHVILFTHVGARDMFKGQYVIYFKNHVERVKMLLFCRKNTRNLKINLKEMRCLRMSRMETDWLFSQSKTWYSSVFFEAVLQYWSSGVEWNLSNYAQTKNRFNCWSLRVKLLQVFVSKTLMNTLKKKKKKENVCVMKLT